LLHYIDLIGEYVNAAYHLWQGQEIILETRPVDPRSLLRGNYALLGYEISRIPAETIAANYPLRNGENVYASLQTDPDGVLKTGVFLLGCIG
jgi:uncharacterized membrane-anchored protein